MSSKYDRWDESELSLEQLDDVTGGAGPAPMGLGGSFAPSATPAATTHTDPLTTRQPGFAPTIFGNSHPAPLGIVHVDDHPIETIAPQHHDAGPVGLGGGWQPDQTVVATTTGLDPLSNDLFDPPTTMEPMGHDAHASGGPMGLGGANE